jgi:alpha-glucan,water dikinase
MLADVLAGGPGEEIARQVVPLDGGDKLAAVVAATPEGLHVRLACDVAGPLLLHWGLAWRFRQEWHLPPEDMRPAGSEVFDALAVRTPFAERDGLQVLEMSFPRPAEGPAPRGLRFVLYGPDGWLKSGGKDLFLPLFPAEPDPRLPAPKLLDLAEQIIAAEVDAASWTLMHRFNLCHDLLAGVEDDAEALSLLYVWLRYSALRQLDWQRSYNTKPRELAHAQDRLTMRLAGIWRRHPVSRPWVRLLLTTLGRGGDGQRVRDEILQIMHRNRLKESAGNFVEEWHQKLHNNTTPDDVVICTAYLDFLRSGGNLGRFYAKLEEGGVTRERLRGFERPIRTDPAFYADRKDALIGEFENFLRILKSVHASADLDVAAAAARGRLDEGLRRKVDALLSAQKTAAEVTAVREGLARALAGAGDDAAVRDLLFLDLALEDTLRAAVERQDLGKLHRDDLVEVVRWVLRGLEITTGSPEVAACAGHWAALCGLPRAGRDWALHARSVADRAARWAGGFSDALYRQIQPKAEYLGTACGVEAWTIGLFGEEVIRGGPAFALALLLRHLDRILRQAADLGAWQVISPARAAGTVRVVERLVSVQAERFAEPTVLVADAVGGNEEIPEGVTGVLTADTPDLVSHVAVRARNAGVLFATCYDPDVYARLKGSAGKMLALRVTPGGDVEQAEDGAEAGRGERRVVVRRRGGRDCPQWVLTHEQFSPDCVGGKSNNLNGLRGRLPDWIGLPASLALPFGACERALADGSNGAVRAEYERLLAQLEANIAVLPRLRGLLQELRPPAGLRAALEGAWRDAGLPNVPWEQAWRGICRVWASKWNERAYLSRRAHGVAHADLRMAVLVQQVVPADCAFVLHTANPLTGERGEVYGEVVLGLGETLVGNYPGRALSFTYRKSDRAVQLLAYPGKSVGLYGKGVIFRSDSNGEDLEGFAGAGLYDSFLAEEPQQRLLDYRGERLVWDRGFRDELLRTLGRVGVEVERLLGSAQDVEGAVAGGKFHVVQTRPQVGLQQG